MTRPEIIAWIMVKEGGYVNRPDDRGGPTNFGITQAYLDDARKRFTDLVLPENVVDLAPTQAAELYRRNEWSDIKGDSLPAGVALLVMDAAVNYGPIMAIVLLQQACKAKVDGKMGPMTLAAVKRAGAPLLEEYTARRGKHYAEDESRGSEFELGWMRRLIACYRRALQP